MLRSHSHSAFHAEKDCDRAITVSPSEKLPQALHLPVWVSVNHTLRLLAEHCLRVDRTFPVCSVESPWNGPVTLRSSVAAELG